MMPSSVFEIIRPPDFVLYYAQVASPHLDVNNPSGRRTKLQAGACLSLERFEAGYSGRIIVMGRAM